MGETCPTCGQTLTDRVPILEVGTFTQHADGWHLSDWRLGGRPSELTVGGWTIEELGEIATDLAVAQSGRLRPC